MHKKARPAPSSPPHTTPREFRIKHSHIPSPPTRRLSLRGWAFAFHGLSAARQAMWTATLQAMDAVVTSLRHLRAGSHEAPPSRNYVLTDYWVDCLPGIAGATCVTEFWLDEVLRQRQWLDPATKPFFTPPPSPSPPAVSRFVTFPMNNGDLFARGTDGSGSDAWLPSSPCNTWERCVPLWPYQLAYLSASPMTTSQELTRVIQLITGDLDTPLPCLERAIDELLDDNTRCEFFASVLPTMRGLVCELPFLFPSSLRLLAPVDEQHAASPLHVESLHLDRVQVLALLSAAFFALWPTQERWIEGKHIDFPIFSMETMYRGGSSRAGEGVEIKTQKIRAILEYFIRMVPRLHEDRIALECEYITYSRHAIKVKAPTRQGDHDPFAQLGLTGMATLPLSPLRVETVTLIEDLRYHVQIDFANKYAGGGVMNSGCVQEEIRFILSPELLVSCLVFARLENHEAFAIHGTERFSDYTGYGGSYRFAGGLVDGTKTSRIVLSDVALGDRHPGAPAHRRDSVVVGIDALSYGSRGVSRQYSRACIRRDLVKALVGFSACRAETRDWPVATGNWGCGVFCGDPELKFLMQWIAASMAKRALVYVMFDKASGLEHKVAALTKLLDPGKAVTDAPETSLSLLLEFLWTLEGRLAQGAEQHAGDDRRRVAWEGGTLGRAGRRQRGSAGRASVLDMALSFIGERRTRHSTLG